MKNNILKILLPELCGIMSLQPSFAQNNINPFVGASIGVSVNNYDMKIAEKAGIPFSTFHSESYQAFTYGINTGLRFLDDSHIYHPGFNLFFEQVNDPVKLTVATGYGYSVDFNVDSTHNLFGFEFDNYIRLAKNEKFFAFEKSDTFLILGLDIGKIKSEYEIDGISLSENGNLFGVKLESLVELKNGAGFSIGCKWLKTEDIEAMSSIFSSRLGLRYTF